MNITRNIASCVFALTACWQLASAEEPGRELSVVNNYNYIATGYNYRHSARGDLGRGDSQGGEIVYAKEWVLSTTHAGGDLYWITAPRAAYDVSQFDNESAQDSYIGQSRGESIGTLNVGGRTGFLIKSKSKAVAVGAFTDAFLRRESMQGYAIKYGAVVQPVLHLGFRLNARAGIMLEYKSLAYSDVRRLENGATDELLGGVQLAISEHLGLDVGAIGAPRGNMHSGYMGGFLRLRRTF